MKLKVTHDLGKEAQRAQQNKQLIKREAWRRLQIVSFNLEREAKFTLPVDTGRLRASWGHWSMSDLLPGKANDASPMDAFWRNQPGDWSITQGSNVHYLQYVNADGKGPQFRRKTLGELADDHQKELNRRIDEIIGLL